jgi:hypothetical protein
VCVFVQLSLAALKAQVEKHHSDKEEQHFFLFSMRRWQGEAFDVSLTVSSEAPAGNADASSTQAAAAADAAVRATPFEVGVYISPHPGRQDMLRLISFSITALAVQQPASAPDRQRRVVQAPPAHIVNVMSRVGMGDSGWGWPNFFDCRALDSWAAFEAYLRASKLVHPGDCLHFKVEVTEVL